VGRPLSEGVRGVKGHGGGLWVRWLAVAAVGMGEVVASARTSGGWFSWLIGGSALVLTDRLEEIGSCMTDGLVLSEAFGWRVCW
jgi:hypothetical protein